MTPTPTMTVAIIVALLVFGIFLYFLFKSPRMAKLKPFPPRWRIVLNQRVRFYKSLSKPEKKRFKKRLQRFLQRVTVTGVDCKVTHGG